MTKDENGFAMFLHTLPDGNETLYHAAQRVLRFLKIDEDSGGGLLSIDTTKASDLLRQAMIREERMLRAFWDGQDDPEPDPAPVDPGPAPDAPAGSAAAEVDVVDQDVFDEAERTYDDAGVA